MRCKRVQSRVQVVLLAHEFLPPEAGDYSLRFRILVRADMLEQFVCHERSGLAVTC